MDRSLLDACALLLGPGARREGPAFLSTLDTAAVRRAWRSVAMATHPDAVRPGGRGAAADGRRFIEASRAYELLMAFLLSRAPGRSRAAARKPAPAAARPRADGPTPKKEADSRRKAGAGPLFYHGPLPRRPLRLAEYLYYSGRISWQSLVSSLVWQHAARPRFGELARELRSITGPELVRILGSRLKGEQTGETAKRLRLLSEEQVERILRLQRLRQKRIGRYFVEKESMPDRDLSAILVELNRHNARLGSGAAAGRRGGRRAG
jgi:hypothetical protein